jgi:cytochrome P450
VAVVVDYPSMHGAECPFRVYEYWRSEAPVYRIPERPNVYVVSRYEDVKHVLRSPELFSSTGSRTGLNGFGFTGEETGGQTMMEADPPFHKAKRDLAFPSLKPGRIKEHASWIEETVDGLIDRFADRGECDFVAEFARPLPVEVMIRLFAIPREDRGLLEKWSDLEVSGLSWIPPEQQERHRHNGVQMGEYLSALILERREQLGDDFVSEVMRAQIERDGELDLEEVRLQVGNVLAGGAATTQHMLGGAMLLLLENPQELERCRSEPARITRALEEAMRLEASVQWVPRVVMADTEIAGTPIPAGTYVLAGIASANRDPSRFDEPDAFEPARRNVADHLSFGTGVHSCIGAPLGRLEGTIAIERLLARLTDIRIAEGEDARHVASPSFRGLARLRLVFRPA